MSATQAEPADTLNPPLVQGLETISRDQAIQFVQYIRYVLPLDGYVFWLRTQQMTVQGSLHASAAEQQNEDESLAVNQVVFTTSTEVDSLNKIAPNTIWVGCWNGLKFAFSRRGPFFVNAGLYHYAGEAVYPAMESQLVDVGAELPRDTLVVSNSLPAWLAIQSYAPQWLVTPNPGITLYPSFAVPGNLPPPYGAVHIEPSQTRALQGAPTIRWHGHHHQLAADHVRVTLYGLTNDQAQDWFDTVNRYSYDQNIIGMMSPSIARDEKRGQVGLDILAMKKTLEFDVSYNQQRINDVARQLIETAAETFYIDPPGGP